MRCQWKIGRKITTSDFRPPWVHRESIHSSHVRHAALKTFTTISPKFNVKNPTFYSIQSTLQDIIRYYFSFTTREMFFPIEQDRATIFCVISKAYKRNVRAGLACDYKFFSLSTRPTLNQSNKRRIKRENKIEKEIIRPIRTVNFRTPVDTDVGVVWFQPHS